MGTIRPAVTISVLECEISVVDDKLEVYKRLLRSTEASFLYFVAEGGEKNKFDHYAELDKLIKSWRVISTFLDVILSKRPTGPRLALISLARLKTDYFNTLKDNLRVFGNITANYLFCKAVSSRPNLDFAPRPSIN